MDCLEFLKSRRSIRVFTDRGVDLKIVLKAIDIAMYAPSAKNSQPWRYINVKDREILDKLSKIYPHANP